jgi:hypothetical protein
MTKKAHITSRPDTTIGDRALAVCGKEFTIRVLWNDIPADKPICRNCVDTMILAATQADALISQARLTAMTLAQRAKHLDKMLYEEGLILDRIADDNEDFQARLWAETEDKLAAERAAKTCTCTWASENDFTVSRDCPIHGTNEEVRDE